MVHFGEVNLVTVTQHHTNSCKQFFQQEQLFKWTLAESRVIRHLDIFLHHDIGLEMLETVDRAEKARGYADLVMVQMIKPDYSVK